LKASDIFESITIFNNNIDPNCIRHGVLNNCYFLSAVSALAEKPERIQSLFLTHEANEIGLYGVRLCLNGKWQEIFVDDYFPCDSKKNFPCFAFSKDGSLWINILEKCYAKAKGSYCLLENGSYEQTIRELTGAPISILDNSNENLLGSIKEACNKNWIITASAGETEASRELLREVGLIPLHTYIIMDIYDLSQLDETNNNFQNNLNISNSQLIFSNSNYDNILKIKNPWGKNEWIGDWSDYSNLWRDDLKIKLNYNSQANCFYMNFKDFKHYFSKIQICKIHDSYAYNSVNLNQSANSYSLVKLIVTQSSNNNNAITHNLINHKNGNNFNINNININLNNTACNYNISNFNLINNNNLNLWNQPVYINLIQNEKKIFKRSVSSDKKYSIARIILSKLSYNSQKDYEVEYITGKISQEKDLFEEKELEPGEYILFIEVDKVNEKNDINNEFDILKYLNNENNFENNNHPDSFFSLTGSKTTKNNTNRINYNYKNKTNNNSFLKEFFSNEKFVISTYSPIEIELIQLKNEHFPNILQKIYISCAKKDNNVLRFTNDGAPNCLK